MIDGRAALGLAWNVTTDNQNAFDLEAYLSRVGYTGDFSPTPATLRALHMAHAHTFPYENLDVLLGRPIRIDLESIQRKLVAGGRGGYCFEQNTLLAAVLERAGFSVTRLAARVRYYSNRVLPRLHMVLQVEAAGQSWLADVGFGGCGLLEAIPLGEGREERQHSWRFRTRRENGLWVLQTFQRGAWVDQYIISPEPQLPVDYEVVNHYCSTHPDSRFLQTLTAQRPQGDTRHILRNRELTTFRADSEETRVIESEEGLLEVLERHFGLRLPAGTRFRPTMIPPL